MRTTTQLLHACCAPRGVHAHVCVGPGPSHPALSLPVTPSPQAICLKECDVYCYKSDLETDPFGEQHGT